MARYPYPLASRPLFCHLFHEHRNMLQTVAIDEVQTKNELESVSSQTFDVRADSWSWLSNISVYQTVLT
jgi:hypothetical protein